MSFEERAEFLMQSIESHDRQIGELTDQVRSNAAEHDRQISQLRDQMRNIMQAIDKLVEVSNDRH
ncbi:MAG TPA: hypothetical protein VG297_24830 [Bryobacteraceae bacterium]|nr:hypothetical protein [Bryobacteraceae bacterium]